jgi:hypothetical protein
MANIFSTPKELKTWAIKLANACGGQKVEKSNILTQINMQRVNELLGQFEAAARRNKGRRRRIVFSIQGLIIMYMFGFLSAFVFLFLESILRDSLNNWGMWITKYRYRKMMNRKQR